jgi:hypothetical protein
MEYEYPNLFAVLKLEITDILGRVISIRSDELVFQSVSDEKIPLESFQHMDVFTKGRIYFRNLPVKVISDNKIQSERSFSKMIMRKITVSFNDSEIAGVLSDITGSEVELLRVNSK